MWWENFWWPTLPCWAKPLPLPSIPISRFWKVLFFGHFKAPQKCGEEGDCARLLLFPENSKPSGEGGKEAKMKYFPFLSFSTFQRPPYTFSPFPSSQSKNLLPFPFPSLPLSNAIFLAISSVRSARAHVVLSCPFPSLSPFNFRVVSRLIS